PRSSAPRWCPPSCAWPARRTGGHRDGSGGCTTGSACTSPFQTSLSRSTTRRPRRKPSRRDCRHAARFRAWAAPAKRRKHTRMAGGARETSGTLTKLIVQYVRRVGGDEAIARVLEVSGVEQTVDQLEDESNWCT